jgi:hypothetical protein
MNDSDPIPLDIDSIDRMGDIKTFDSAPDLKLQTKFGVFLWWSDKLPKWIHPDDLPLAEKIVPGFRIFRREPSDAPDERKQGYARLHYGKQSFRAFPIVWLEVASEGFEVGDRVEIKSEHGKRKPGLANIDQMLWNRNAKQIEYFLIRNGMKLERKFEGHELSHAVELEGYLDHRRSS